MFEDDVPMTFSRKQVGRMRSGDFGKPMSRVTEFDTGRTKDNMMNARELGQDLKQQGFKRPLHVAFTYNGAMLLDGHHKYLGATSAGINKLPARVNRDDRQDLIHFKAQYTPPGQEHTWQGFKHKNK